MTAVTTEQKRIKPLVGEDLIRKVKELGKLNRIGKAKACGYYSVTRNGLERVNMKQFLNALVEAEGIELDGTGRDNGHSERRASGQITVKPSGRMDSNSIVTVKRLNKPVANPKTRTQPTQQLEEPQIEPVPQPQIEQPEQLEPEVHIESLAEPPREESVAGSGWSLAQLMNEFSGR